MLAMPLSVSLFMSALKRNTFSLPSVILCISRVKRHTLKLFLKEIIKYTIKASLCIQNALQWPCLLHSSSRKSIIPLPNLFHHQTTHLTQSYRDGHESTFRHGWASASSSGKPPHHATCVDASGFTGNKRSWQCNERIFLWLHLPVHSFSSNTLQGLFHNSRQADYATAVA